MWDEKKFFKDYKEEADQIKPDASFVERLKQQTNPDNVVRLEKRTKKRRQMTYVAAAATVLLCVGIGGAGASVFFGSKDSEGVNGLHAGNTQDETGKTVGNSISSKDKELSKLISMLENTSAMLDDANGNSLSTEEREKFVEMLKHLEKLENDVEIADIDFSKEAEVYYCTGVETVKIEVYEERYVKIENSVYVLKDN